MPTIRGHDSIRPRRSRTALFPLVVLAACASPMADGDVAPAPREESAGVRMLLDLHADDPENEVVLYTLARAMDREGRVADVLGWLGRLEETEWDDFLELDDFPQASPHPSFQALAARIADRARVESRAEVAFELDLADLAPEGTAWDPRRGEVLLSSGRQRKVVAVDARGRTREVTTEAQDGLLGTLGMEVDAHDRVWVASTAIPFMRGFTPEMAGAAAVFAFDLATGETVGRWDADGPSLLNDLALADGGGVYVTDTRNGHVLALDTASGSWSPLGTDVRFIGPNGIALAPASDALFVADLLGLTRIDLGTGRATRLAAPPGARNLGGIDGLAYVDGALVGIQNLVGRGRVWRIVLDPDERRLLRAELLEAGHPSFRNPTTGAAGSDGYYYFLADPALQSPSADGLEPMPEGARHTLLRIRVSRSPGTRAPEPDARTEVAPPGGSRPGS